MKRTRISLAYGCALSMALGAMGCMGDELEDAGDEAADGVATEQPGVDEEGLDPELAEAIAGDKMAELGIEPSSLRHANCGTAGPFLDGTVIADAASPNAANQRNGSSTGCPADGVLQPSDDAQYFCFTFENPPPFTWTYLQNLRTGVRGWVRDDLLREVGGVRGSAVFCGF
jgi:hypothetical protein